MVRILQVVFAIGMLLTGGTTAQEHGAGSARPSDSSPKRAQGSIELKALVSDLPTREELSRHPEQEASLERLAQEKLKPVFKHFFAGCEAPGPYVFSVEREKNGARMLKRSVQTSLPGADVISYPFRPVGIRGNWIILEKDIRPGFDREWLGIKIIDQITGPELRLVSIGKRGSELVIEASELFESSEIARCEGRLPDDMKKLGEIPEPDLLSVKEFPFQTPLHVGIVSTPAQQKAVETYARYYPGSLFAYGPLLIFPKKPDQQNLDDMVSTYSQFDHFRPRLVPLNKLSLYKELESFLAKNELLPPSHYRQLTLLHEPRLVFNEGSKGWYLPKEEADEYFVYFKTPEGTGKVFEREFGKNLVMIRYPAQFMEKEMPDTLLHEWMHALDMTYFNFSIHDEQQAIERTLQEKFEKAWPEIMKQSRESLQPSDRDGISDFWLYHHLPWEKVAKAVQVAYLRDVRKLTFREVLEHFSYTNIMHRFAPYHDYETKLYQSFYDRKDLKALLEEIRREAMRLAREGAEKQQR